MTALRSVVLPRGHRHDVARLSGTGDAARGSTWSRAGVVMATVVAPVVLVGGGLVVGRLAGWSWATAIFLGVVAYVLVIDAAWLVSGALAVRRELRAWRLAQDLDEERTGT